MSLPAVAPKQRGFVNVQARDSGSTANHGATRLPAVEVASYNVELKDDEGFIGDRASKGAFRQFIDNWRKPMQELGEDPFGEDPRVRSPKNG
jgi:hypothetical protein